MLNPFVPGARSRYAALFGTLLAFCVTDCARADSPPSTSAPNAKSQDPLDRKSPQSSMLSFLEACKAGDYKRAMRYLNLNKLTPEQRRKEGPELARDLATILERDAQFDVAALSPDPEGNKEKGLPADRDRLFSLTADGKVFELQLERVSLRQADVFVWLVAPESVSQIPKLVQLTSESPLERLLPPPLVRIRLVETAVWRWIALLLLIAAGVAVSRLLARLTVALASPLLKLLDGHMEPGTLGTLVTPVQGLCFAFLVRIGAAWIDPAPKVGLYVTRGLTLISFLSIAWLCMRLLELGTNRLRTAIEARHRTISHSVLPMATRVLKVTILVFAILAVLSSWGYNTSAALAGLGIGGVAIALAAQKTIENVFGGVAVISDRPVHVGDFCRFGESVGTVEDIGLRSTRIRTLDRTLLTVPNAQFSSVALENFSRRDKMLFHIKLNLRRDTSPDQVRTVLDSIRTILTQHPLVESGDLPVRFIGLGTYSLDVEVFVYVKTESGDEYLKIQQELLLRILDAIAAAGTALALPTQASVSYSTPADAAQPNPEREPALSHR